MSKKRIRTGQGRVEFFANKPIIFDLLDQGFTVTSVHEKLINDGKITMSYKTLNALVKKQRNIKKVLTSINSDPSIIKDDNIEDKNQKNKKGEDKTQETKTDDSIKGKIIGDDNSKFQNVKLDQEDMY